MLWLAADVREDLYSGFSQSGREERKAGARPCRGEQIPKHKE
jgi:hypothetical protein